MFGFPSKRPRDHDELLVDVHENAPRENKKPRPLTLRTSPNSCRLPSFTDAKPTASRFRPSTLTPVESSDEDDNGDTGKLHKFPADTTDTLRQLPQSLQSPALAYCTAMDVDSGRDMQHRTNNYDLSTWPTSAHSNGSIQTSPIPHSLINQSLKISERPMTSSTHGRVAISDQGCAPPADQGPFKDPNITKGQDTTWCDQRLPSPISEDEDAMASSKCSVSDTEMSYNASHPASSPGCAPHNEQWLWLDASDMRQEAQQHDVSPATRTDPPTTAAPSKKKVTFSMGFRADCDKCRRKVPGHYSHILRA